MNDMNGVSTTEAQVLTTEMVETIVNKKGFVNMKTSGVSMRPFIKTGRDTIIAEKNLSRLKKHDVALFKRANGDYILHRVTKVLPDGYIIIGDNCTQKERVFEQQILGVMTGYYKGEKFISCQSFWYKFKTRLYCFLPIKMCWIFCSRCFGKLKRILKEKKKTKS